MKIGILNLFKVNNYGAVLQAFALEKAIRSLGYDVETISYIQRISKHIYNFECVRRLGLKAFLLRAANFALIMDRREKAFERFRKNRMSCSRSYDEKTVKSIVNDYDRLVVGSDIVWSTDPTAFDPNLFLPFDCDPYKKIGYAVSIGGKEFTAEKDFVMKWIPRFSEISVREATTSPAIKELTGRDVPVMPDPTFLLTPEEWESVCAPVKERRYIFVYQLRIDKKLVQFVNKLAKEQNCSVVYCPFPMGGLCRSKFRPWISVERWLGYIRHAEYVVTDSFYAVCFSAMFERKFYVMISAYGARIEHRLAAFGMSDRLLTGAAPVDFKAPVDFTDALASMKAEREAGLCYLAEILTQQEPNTSEKDVER